jgi:hypothetical protein
MKTLKLIAIAVLSLMILESMTDAQVKSNAQTKRQIYDRPFLMYLLVHMECYFPLPKILNQTFKPGGTVGLDIGYRINRELALYGKFGYYFIHLK